MVQEDLSDPKRVSKRVLDERLVRRRELEDVGYLMNGPVGRRFLWRLLKEGRIYETCFTGNNTTFYNEGRRDLAAKFLMDTQMFPDLYLQMVRENQKVEIPEVTTEKE